MQQITQIVEQTAAVFDCTAVDILARSRRPAIVLARQAAMWVVRQRYPSISLAAIGAAIGGRHYSTVMHALQMVAQRMEQNPHYRAQVEHVLQCVSAKPPRVPTNSPMPLHQAGLMAVKIAER